MCNYDTYKLFVKIDGTLIDRKNIYKFIEQVIKKQKSHYNGN
jgi:hypothetical protein